MPGRPDRAMSRVVERGPGERASGTVVDSEGEEAGLATDGHVVGAGPGGERARHRPARERVAEDLDRRQVGVAGAIDLEFEVEVLRQMEGQAGGQEIGPSGLEDHPGDLDRAVIRARRPVVGPGAERQARGEPGGGAGIARASPARHQRGGRPSIEERAADEGISTRWSRAGPARGRCRRLTRGRRGARRSRRALRRSGRSTGRAAPMREPVGEELLVEPHLPADPPERGQPEPECRGQLVAGPARTAGRTPSAWASSWSRASRSASGVPSPSRSVGIRIVGRIVPSSTGRVVRSETRSEGRARPGANGIASYAACVSSDAGPEFRAIQPDPKAPSATRPMPIATPTR